MKSIRINKQIRLEMVELGGYGETMDSILSRLLDDIGPESKEKVKHKDVGMKISEETYQKLKSKQGKNETLINTIERAIANAKASED